MDHSGTEKGDNYSQLINRRND